MCTVVSILFLVCIKYFQLKIPSQYSIDPHKPLFLTCYGESLVFTSDRL